MWHNDELKVSYFNFTLIINDNVIENFLSKLLIEYVIEKWNEIIDDVKKWIAWQSKRRGRKLIFTIQPKRNLILGFVDFMRNERDSCIHVCSCTRAYERPIHKRVVEVSNSRISSSQIYRKWTISARIK